MLGQRLQRWANIALAKTLQALIIDLTTNIIVNIIISEFLQSTFYGVIITCITPDNQLLKVKYVFHLETLIYIGT